MTTLPEKNKSIRGLQLNISGLPSEPRGFIQVGNQAIPMYIGLIGHIDPIGFCIILDATGKEHPFTFDAVVGYEGQTAESLGFNIGQQVKFAMLGEKVAVVQQYTEPTSASNVSTTRPNS